MLHLYELPSRESDAGPLPPHRDPDEDRPDDSMRFVRGVLLAIPISVALWALAVAAIYILSRMSIAVQFYAIGFGCAIAALLIAMANLPKGGTHA